MQILNRFRLKALPIQPENFPENLVWTYIIWNYPIYFVGAQFVLAPILGWLLLGYLTIKWWSQNEDTPEKDKIQISITSWIWVVATFVMALTHFIGCIDFNVDTYVMFRDFINGWIKMWALFAIFPLVGHLNIRPQLIYRAVCVFCAQSLVLVLLFWMIAFATDGHSFTYISPFLKIGGQLNYYSIIIGNALDIEEKRIYLNAPWAPALGMMAGIYLFLYSSGTSSNLEIAGYHRINRNDSKHIFANSDCRCATDFPFCSVCYLYLSAICALCLGRSKPLRHAIH